MTRYFWNDQEVALVERDDYDLDAVVRTPDGREWEVHQDSLEERED